jgi:hypothetical protein
VSYGALGVGKTTAGKIPPHKGLRGDMTEVAAQTIPRAARKQPFSINVANVGTAFSNVELKLRHLFESIETWKAILLI